jgi:choice-of-anchor B domain-containing protein
MSKNSFLIIFCVISFCVKAQNVNVVQRGSLSYPNKECANICGYVDSTGKEYALVGVETGMSIVDVSDPDNPFELTSVPWPPGPSQLWKEIKVYKNYAYVAAMAGSGLQICDLRHLPTAFVPYQQWQPSISGTMLGKIHALHVDTTMGNIYLYGTNIGNSGAICADLSDPWNPSYLGSYDPNYVHDGYVDNDTLYAAEIFNGTCTIVDFTNKSSPQVICSFHTPNNFPHNTWPLVGKKYLFTTDEISNSFLTSYGISDFGNVTELDKIQSNAGSNSIVHNTHITKDSFAVTSWYRDGFTIVDVSRPNNMIQVGNYDTHPNASGNGFNGAWGVYPFLPSKTIVVSNIEDGLHVLTPTYKRACWLEGNIKDSLTLVDLAGVDIEIVGLTQTNTVSLNDGNYATGTVEAGTYTIQISKAGYETLLVTDVVLTNGVLSILNRKLLPSATGIYQYESKRCKFNVSENPFSDCLVVSYTLSNNVQSANLTIIDNLGKQLEHHYLKSNEEKLRVGKYLSPGIYYVLIDNMAPIKVIKTN